MPGRCKLAFTLALMCVATESNALPGDIGRASATHNGMHGPYGPPMNTSWWKLCWRTSC